MSPSFSNRQGLGTKHLAQNCCQKHPNQCLSLDWLKLKCQTMALMSTVIRSRDVIMYKSPDQCCLLFLGCHPRIRDQDSMETELPALLQLKINAFPV